MIREAIGSYAGLGDTTPLVFLGAGRNERSDVVTPGVFTRMIREAIGSYAGLGDTTPLATTIFLSSGRMPAEYIC